MRQIELPSWEAFEEELKDLLADRDRRQRESVAAGLSNLLFRGQSDSSWRLETTLERYAPHSLKVSDYYRRINSAKFQIESFTGQRWDMPTPPEFRSWLNAGGERFGLFDLPGEEYMVYLRHHGFPSPFLDWSQSPYVAAFFAFNDALKQASHVSIYAFLEYAGDAKSGWKGEPWISGRGPNFKSHRRHFLQQCEYTICTVLSDGQWYYACHEDAFARGNEEQDLLWKFNIPSDERLKVLSLLGRYNLNAFSLFGSEESLMETLALREFLFRKG